jgi:hypothetical protein
MKIRVTLKDPDGFYESVRDAVTEWASRQPDLDQEEREQIIDARMTSVWKKLGRWVEYKEYVDIEFDTEAMTATVVARKP